MSKASQRRLADRQKRAQKMGVPSRRDMNSMLAYGPDAIDEIPVTFWKCIANNGKQSKPHPQSKALEEFFKSQNAHIDQLIWAGTLAEESTGSPLPGIVLHGKTSDPTGYPECIWPLSIEARSRVANAEAMLTFLREEIGRLELINDGTDETPLDMSLWLFGIPSGGNPVICIGVTAGGAYFVRINVEGQWILGRNDLILDIAIEEVLSEPEVFHQQYSFRATMHILSGIMKELGIKPTEVQPDQMMKMLARIREGIDEGASPYLELVIGALEHAQFIEAMTKDEAQMEVREKEHAHARFREKANSELNSVREQLERSMQVNAHLQKQHNSFGNKERQPTHARQENKEDLAQRLDAFF